MTGFGSNDSYGSSTIKHLEKVDRKRAKEEKKVGKLSKKEAHVVSNMFRSRSDGSGRMIKPASWVINNNVSIETPNGKSFYLFILMRLNFSFRRNQETKGIF